MFCCWPSNSKFIPAISWVKLVKAGYIINCGSKTANSQGSVNGGFQTVVRVSWGNEIPLPPFYLNLTSFLPQISGEKKAYTALLQCRTFLCRKKWGLQRKDFGGGYGFPGFYRVFVSTTGLESFSFGPEKFSKRFSFGGGGVRFFLL